MSKYIADETFFMKNESNDLVMSYVVRGFDRDIAMQAFQEIKNCGKRIEVEIKPYRSKRSLEQNRLLWALLGKLSQAMNGSTDKESVEECYILMLEQANVAFDFLLALPETEQVLKQTFRVVKKIGEREVGEKKLNMYQCYRGSSKFDTKEMTELIECTLNKLAELGVYDSEIMTAREEFL